MKYGTDMKLAAFVNKNVAIVAIKKRNGLLTTISDTSFYGDSGGFTCDIGGTFTSVTFRKVGKKFKVVVDIPRKEKQVFFHAKSLKKFRMFLTTDYCGYVQNNIVDMLNS